MNLPLGYSVRPIYYQQENSKVEKSATIHLKMTLEKPRSQVYRSTCQAVILLKSEVWNDCHTTFINQNILFYWKTLQRVDYLSRNNAY